MPTQFKPGRSGNPGGRPKRKLITECFQRILEKPVPGDDKGRTYADQIAFAIVSEAINGNVRAAIEIADRVEGRAKQALEIVDDVDVTKSREELIARMTQLIERGAVRIQKSSGKLSR
jgi:hypothetical protein